MLILDSIENAGSCYTLGARIEQALRFLQEQDFGALEPGRYDIDGDDCFAIVQRYQTRPVQECIWESHRSYIDIQFVASGIERIGHALQSAMTVHIPYSAEKDQAVYTGEGDLLTVRAGYFAIFFPGEVHMPMVQNGRPAGVTKVVVKVRAKPAD